MSDKALPPRFRALSDEPAPPALAEALRAAQTLVGRSLRQEGKDDECAMLLAAEANLEMAYAGIVACLVAVRKRRLELRSCVNP